MALDGFSRPETETTGVLERFHPVWEESSDPDAPVIILLHGTGGNERQMFPLIREILNGRPASLLGLRGRELEQGHVTRWFKRLAEGLFDTQSVLLRSRELADAIMEAGEAYGFDPGKAVAVGYSNGANVAAAMMLTRPGVIRGAAMIRTMLPLEPEAVPGLSGSSALLLSGRHDPYGPLTSAEALAAVLKQSGAEVEHPVLEAGHEIREEDLLIVRSWLSRLFPVK